MNICPANVLELVEDEFDIDAETDTVAVTKGHSKKIKSSCGPCKPSSGYNITDLPCVRACTLGAIQHSW